MDDDLAIHSEDQPYIIKSKDVDYEDQFGIGYQLFHHMKKYKNHVAQRILENNYEESYGSLLQKSISTAIKLRSKNFSDSSIIAICAENHADTCIPFIAASFLGNRITTFDGTLSERDTSFLLRQLTPAIMFIDERFVPTMEGAMRGLEDEFDLVVFGRHDRYSTFDEYLYDNGEEVDFEPVQLTDTLKTGIILFSSGTTGLPKGICLSHRGILKQAYSAGAVQCISSESVIYYLTTLNWITSVCLMITCTVFGATRVISPISKGWHAIEKYKVTHISFPPYLASALVHSEKPINMTTNSVKSIWTTGTALNTKLLAKLIENFPGTSISQSYGQTETSGWITMFPNGEQRSPVEKPTSVGKLVPGICAKIVHPETKKILGPQEVGELRLRCDASCMNGYFNKDSSDQFDSKGWLKTGDLMYFDEDECFYIAGRCKEMLKYRGFHIQPQMLEQILESHHAVNKAVVIGIPREEGDHPMGIVVLQKGENITPEILEHYVEKQVQERQRLRSGIKIIKEMPFTRTGKPIKHILKRMVENGEI